MRRLVTILLVVGGGWLVATLPIAAQQDLSNSFGCTWLTASAECTLNQNSFSCNTGQQPVEQYYAYCQQFTDAATCNGRTGLACDINLPLPGRPGQGPKNYSNTFSCAQQITGCAVGSSDCSPGYKPDPSQCSFVSCQTTQPLSCVSTAQILCPLPLPNTCQPRGNTNCSNVNGSCAYRGTNYCCTTQLPTSTSAPAQPTSAPINKCSAPNRCQQTGRTCPGSYVITPDCSTPASATVEYACCQASTATLPSAPISTPRGAPLEQGFTRFDTPCYLTKTPEFAPLRPYPGSPCDPLIPKAWPERENISFACGKSLNIENDVSFSRQRPTQDMPANPGEGLYWCDRSHTEACLIRKFDYDVKIDLSGATIPILGNTQDGLDDATRVNQYLLSYLTGTVQQAEQIPLDKNDPSAIDRLINFAGPLKKLLSFDSQNQKKSQFVQGPKFTDYHNYVVGCQKKLGLDYVRDLVVNTIKFNLATFGDIVKLGVRLIAFPFDQLLALINLLGDLASQDLTNDQKVVAIIQSDLVGNDLEIINILLSISGNYWQNLKTQVQTINLDAAVVCTPGGDYKRLTDVAGKLPPDPKDYVDFNEYWNEYLNWRGGWAAVNLPWFGTVNPFEVTSVWASLFQNVPFTTLEDTMSEFTVAVINSASQQPEGVITGDSSHPITLTISGGDSRLSFPHVKAINALSQLLQNLMAPKDLRVGFDPTQKITSHQAANDNPEPQKIEVVTNPFFCNPKLPLVYNSFLCNNSSVVPPSVLEGSHAAPPPLFTGHDSLCDLKDVRINPGDYLYGQNVTAQLTYYQKFTYSPNPAAGFCTPNGDDCVRGSDCCSGQCNLRAENRPDLGFYCAGNDIQDTTEARVAVFSKTPLIDKIYDNLVASTRSVFRRFLHAQPCAPNCSTEEAKHYIRQGAETFPAAIGATYTGDGKVTAGDKSGGGQIYIPRLGSLFDYFLGAANENMNLQKMLRPKGYGGSGTAGLVSTPGGICQIPQAGLCSLNDPQTQLQNNFPTSYNTAAYICNRESQSNALAINDGCLQNPIHNTRVHTADYSVGLFQINLLSHPAPAFLNIREGETLKAAIAAAGRAGKSCYEAFTNWKIFQDPANYGEYCVVGDPVLLNTCVQWFQSPVNTIAYVKNLSGNGTNWDDWSTYTGTQCQQP